jgi:hypothetical protein
MPRCFALVVILQAAVLTTAVTHGQQEPEAAAPSGAAADASPAERFAPVHREWTALDKRLNELQQTYATTTSPAAREELKRQYEELVGRSNELLPVLHQAALAAYETAPNKSANVLRTLIGLVAYEFRRDNYEAAIELARVLESHDCAEAVLYAVAGAAAYNADDTTRRRSGSRGPATGGSSTKPARSCWSSCPSSGRSGRRSWRFGRRKQRRMTCRGSS